MPYLKIFLIYSSGGPLDQQSETDCSILVEGIIRNISVKLFEFGPVVQEDMWLNGISYLELWRPLCSAEQNLLCNYGSGHYKEHFCEIVLNLEKKPEIFLI